MNFLEKKMKAVQFLQPGGPEVLQILETQVPIPKEQEVLIQVLAAGINRPDLMQREGKYPPPPGASPILGLEVSGKIVAVGNKSRWRVGDEVCALVPGGGYAQYCIAPDLQCLPLPKGLSFEECAGIPETFFTVWANVFQHNYLKQGSSLLVHGGSSGIGTTAIQLAAALGVTSYATAGSQAKCDACLKIGARAAFNYREQDFVSALKGVTNNQGVDMVLDMIGGPYTPKNIECLAPKGYLVQIAVQQGPQATINLLSVMQKRLVITGSTMRPRTIEEKGQIASELLQDVWPLFESKRIRVCMDKIFPFAQVQEAHRYLESGQHVGKIVLNAIA